MRPGRPNPWFRLLRFPWSPVLFGLFLYCWFLGSRRHPWSPAPWSPVLFWLFLYCWLLVSRGSRGSRRGSRGLPLPLPWFPVVSRFASRGLPFRAPWLLWSPVSPPVVSRSASRGLLLLVWSHVVSRTVNPYSLLFKVQRRQGVVVVVVIP